MNERPTSAPPHRARTPAERTPHDPSTRHPAPAAAGRHCPAIAAAAPAVICAAVAAAPTGDGAAKGAVPGGGRIRPAPPRRRAHTGAEAEPREAALAAGREVLCDAVEPQRAACHAPADAGVQGEIGPNLAAFAPDVARAPDALAPDDARFHAAACTRDVVPRGAGVMPARENTPIPEPIDAAAAYVAGRLRWCAV